MENPIKMDDLGVPLFLETPKSTFPFLCPWTASRHFLSPVFFRGQSIMPNMNSSRETTPSWCLLVNCSFSRNKYSDSFHRKEALQNPTHFPTTQKMVKLWHWVYSTIYTTQTSNVHNFARKAWLASTCSKEAAMLENQSSASQWVNHLSQGRSTPWSLGMGNLQPLMTGILISWGPINPDPDVGWWVPIPYYMEMSWELSRLDPIAHLEMRPSKGTILEGRPLKLPQPWPRLCRKASSFGSTQTGYKTYGKNKQLDMTAASRKQSIFKSPDLLQKLKFLGWHLWG